MVSVSSHSGLSAAGARTRTLNGTQCAALLRRSSALNACPPPNGWGTPSTVCGYSMKDILAFNLHSQHPCQPASLGFGFDPPPGFQDIQPGPPV